MAEVGVPDRPGHDEVDRPTKELRERLDQAEVGVGVLAGRQGREVDKEVEIAPLWVEVVAGGRAEQGEPEHVMAPAELRQLGAVLFDRGNHGTSSLPTR